MISKKQVVAQLEETAQLLELIGEDTFRAKAFQNAARRLDEFEGDFETYFLERRIDEIKGIGKSLASEIYMLSENTMAIPSLELLHQQVPESVRDLFRVAGLGPKKVGVLWQHGIAGLHDLLAASQDGRIAALKGFGEKSAEKIRQSTQFVLANQTRMRLNVAEAYNQFIIQHLAQHLPEANIETAGDYRRRCETVAELFFVLSNTNLETLQEALRPILSDIEITANTLSGKLEFFFVQFVVCPQEVLGTVLAIQTGNQEFVESLQRQAQKQDLELRSDGLFKQNRLVLTPSEDDLFKALDITWVTPERRESSTLEQPQNLLDLTDIHGMVHNHSTWSDAEHSIRDMVRAAQERGYSYLAMADHSRTSYYANGLSIDRVFEQAKEIQIIREELNTQGSTFELLHGIEVDILSDGSLDYPDEVLSTLDYTVVSVHQNFTLSEKAQTERIIEAIQNPYAKILGHMTGRLLLRRQPYALDIQAVITACAETKTVIEINANPYRLDLDWRWVIKAKELGCTFSINPDAHNTQGFDDIRFGVMMARKGGLTAKDVVNTALTGQAFLSQLKQV
jgi:DNA polymerase (family 10)